MKPVIINGSPRNKKSNSGILIGKFIEGYMTSGSEAPDLFYLADPNQRNRAIDAFNTSNTIIIIFPLYTDCMPGIVKEFFENISPAIPDKNKRIGFIVQSGFPEAKQSECIERYLKKFTVKRLRSEYLGTIIKGGVEGIQIMPGNMTRNLFSSFKELGANFARTGTFSEEIKARLGTPYKLSRTRIILFRLFKLTGLTNFYWNSRLKKNKAFQKRFDTPYQPV
ncbi:MAG: NAD(P)H-dependent oxidoreductase [Bacteroidales bacterium]|nr:NAD(P)H-dependent oxidoreductase [Bacteroidales bacterium]